MVNYNGGQSFLLAGVEFTYNTPVSPTKDLGIVSSIDVSASNNIIDVRGIGNRQSQDLIAGNFDASLSLSGTLNSGAIFELFFGQATDTLTSSDYKHVFIADGTTDVLNTISSFTLQENYDSTSDVTNKWAGCVVNTIDVSVVLNEVVTIDVEILAADEDVATTAGTKVVTTTSPLSFSQCTLSTGNEGSESTVTQVQDFNISFNNNYDLRDIRGIGSRLSQGALPKNLEVTGEFTMKFQNTTEEQRFLGGTAATSSTPTDTGLIFQATNGVTLGSGRIEFYVRLYGVQYEELGRTVSNDGIVETNFSFRATTIKDVYTVDAVSTYF